MDKLGLSTLGFSRTNIIAISSKTNYHLLKRMFMLFSSLAALVSISLMFLRQYLRFLSSLEFSSNSRGGSLGLILYTIAVTI